MINNYKINELFFGCPLGSQVLLFGYFHVTDFAKQILCNISGKILKNIKCRTIHVS